ncbi:MAG: ACT domain-containing protein, partial [Planctomycetes bacterium]|nr:ACT domain-containing protein [Planctomycetota bacterium]
ILLICNNDRPGVIGAVGTICAKHNINIGTMGVGRVKTENRAVLVLDIDETPPEKAIEELRKQDFVINVYVCELPTGNND